MAEDTETQKSALRLASKAVQGAFALAMAVLTWVNVQTGSALSEVKKSLEDHRDRIVRLETFREAEKGLTPRK